MTSYSEIIQENRLGVFSMKLKISKPKECKPHHKEDGTISYPPGWCYDIELDGKTLKKA